MELSINDIRDLIGHTSTGPDALDPRPGDKLIIRTVTMTLSGHVVDTSAQWIVLDSAAWIADSGRWADALASGTLSEVEPMGDGVRVSKGAIVDMTPWKHQLPTEQK